MTKSTLALIAAPIILGAAIWSGIPAKAATPGMAAGSAMNTAPASSMVTKIDYDHHWRRHRRYWRHHRHYYGRYYYGPTVSLGYGYPYAYAPPYYGYPYYAYGYPYYGPGIGFSFNFGGGHHHHHH